MPCNQPHFKNIGKNKIAISLEIAEHSYARKTVMSLVILHSLCWTALKYTNLAVQEESYFSSSYKYKELEFVTLVGLDSVEKRMFTRRICWVFYSTGLYLLLPPSPAVLPVQSRIKVFWVFSLFFNFMQETWIVASKPAATVFLEGGKKAMTTCYKLFI